MISYRPDYLIN